MYEEFYGNFGLERNPFEVSPNPQRFFSTTAHDEALLQLVSGIEARQGLMVLTGEAGTGKTTILHYLLEWVQEKHGYSTAYVCHTMVSPVDLLWLILQDFGILCESRSKGDLLIALGKWLLVRQKAGDCPVIFIDEAQGLKGKTLDELRMLLNLEVGGAKLVQLVLAGQPRLAEKLRWRKLDQLRQRISLHCTLPALSAEETTGYIGSRLAGAGATDLALFPAEAVQEIFLCSKGIPRVINLVCEHAMLAAYAEGRASVNCGDVLRVAQQFDLIDDVYAEREPLQLNAFCRLIPFPRLREVEVAADEAKQEVMAQAACEPDVVSAAVEPEFMVAAGEPRPNVDVAIAEAEPVNKMTAEADAQEVEPVTMAVALTARAEAAELMAPVMAETELVEELQPAIEGPALTEMAIHEPVIESTMIAERTEPQECMVAGPVEEVAPVAAPVVAEPVFASVAVEEKTAAQELAVACLEVAEIAVAGPAVAEVITVEPVVASTMVKELVAPQERCDVHPVAARAANVSALVIPKPTVVTAPVLAEPVAKKIVKWPKTVKPEVVASPIAKAVVVIRGRSRQQSHWRAFESYWGKVGDSFVRDTRQLWRQGAAWLRTPAAARGPVWNWRRMVSAATTWLRAPLGSAPIGAQHSRVSPVTHKQV